MLKIGILGAGGKMGQAIIKEISAHPQKWAVLAAIEHETSPLIGKDLGEIFGPSLRGITVSKDKQRAFSECDIIIDFTSKGAVLEHLKLAAQNKKPIVIGTTGLGPEEKNALRATAREAPVLYAPNMSLGVNILLPMIEQMAKKLGQEYDVEIFEAHHRHKADAPSGTSLALADAAARGRGMDLKDLLVTDRASHPGSRKQGTIGISVFRGGDIAGEHTVTFAGNGERIELSHKATDRSLFAKGALQAVLWLHGKPAGLYSMQDVIS